jgi:squalene-associated FAD-dependent desaturase
VKVAVIGGGLAGLAAAVELCDLGHSVTLFERRPWAGGKTYSFVDEVTGEAVDNGQHVFMTCTTAYVGFLRRLGTLHLARRQRRLCVPVFDASGRRSDIRVRRLPAPLHLAAAFATYRHLSLADKLRVLRAMASVVGPLASSDGDASSIPFEDWLRRRGQPTALIRDFWDFVILPTLNCRAHEASAADALFVLREGFLKSSTSAALGVPGVGLSELHVDPAVRAIEATGGSVRLRTTVDGLGVVGHRITNLRLQGGETFAFDGYVLALPPAATLDVLPEDVRARPDFLRLRDIKMAPIINLHCWFDRPVASWPLAAFTGSELQWVFNRSRLDRRPPPGDPHLVVSLSGAAPFMALDRTELEARFLPQLRQALPTASEARLTRFLAIKEPEATFLPAPGLQRPGAITPFANLVLAGAYTATGWPATMESAVRSGLTAAHELHARSTAAPAPTASVASPS